MVFGACEISEEARKLLCYAADLALLKNRLYRRWGIETARALPGSRSTASGSSCGNPDFTNAPGHGDDDARYYNRQQAYVHAPDTPPRPPGVAPKPELTIALHMHKLRSMHATVCL